MAKGKFCYYCGIELKTGKNGNRTTEHVPPQMMFQAFECDSITVPSCPEHNSSRSGQDQAFIAGFMKALNSDNYYLHEDVRKAIEFESKKSTFETTKNIAQPKPFFKNPTGNRANLSDVTHIKFSPEDWIRQITAGLVYDATQKHDPSINWEQAFTHHANWYPGNGEGFEEEDGLRLLVDKTQKTQVWEELDWLKGWSAYSREYPSNIYRFYVYFAKPILFKHVFFNSFTSHISFECSEAARKPLGHKVLVANG